MWGKISQLLGIDISTCEVTSDKDGYHIHELHLVTAALLVHVSLSHDDFSEDEKASVLLCITGHFDIEETVAHQILDKATQRQEDAIDLHSFTRVITRELEQEGRQEIVRLLWQVAFSDNHLDGFEANAISKIAGLLGVSTRDRVLIKQEVQQTIEATATN